MKRFVALSRLAIYTGPLAFAIGLPLALVGEFSGRPAAIFTGLSIAAAGLIVWGCHGMRRRGRRPGFVIMSGLGGFFLLLHLYYRCSDYRWAKLNSMSISSASATIDHLEARIVFLLVMIAVSIVIGLLPPLPESRRNFSR